MSEAQRYLYVICPTKPLTTRPRSAISSAQTQGNNATNTAYLRVLLVIILLRTDPSRRQVISNRMRQSEIVISSRGHISILDHGEMQVAIEGLLDVGHIFHLGDASNTDLLALIVIRQHGDRALL